MTTQEKREFNLTLTLESNEIIKFIDKMDPEKFVSMHQNCFKDHYLRQPPIENGDEFINENDIWDNISEKYIEFFKNMGLEETYKWLNPSLYTNWSENLKKEDISMKVIKYEVLGEGDLEGEEYDELEVFGELYYETFSCWAYDWFVYEIVEKYYEYMNELSLVKQ